MRRVKGAKLSSMPENWCKGTAQEISDCQDSIIGAVVQYAKNNGVTIAATDVVVNQQAAWVRAQRGGAGIFGSRRVTVTYSYPIVYLKIAPGFTIPDSILFAGKLDLSNFYGS